MEILKGRFGEEKVGTRTFPEQKHGFMIRGDVKEAEVHKAVEEGIKLGHEYMCKF